MHDVCQKQRLARFVPWFGPPSDTHSSTELEPPRNFKYQRDESPPMEWVTMSTFAAPVAARIWLTFVAIWLAVVLFDCAVLYDQLLRLVNPSAWKRLIMVFQTEPLELHPWTNRIGSAAWADAAGTSTAVAASSTTRVFLMRGRYGAPAPEGNPR